MKISRSNIFLLIGIIFQIISWIGLGLSYYFENLGFAASNMHVLVIYIRKSSQSATLGCVTSIIGLIFCLWAYKNHKTEMLDNE